MRRHAKMLAVWLFLGSLLVQIAWVFAIPPFAGIDEFDHAYRAAGVAHGQWAPSGDLAQDGRGELVKVPAGIVVDAEPACTDLPYIGPDNCTAVEHLDDGLVTVASAAARYNPVYYWVIGTTALPFEGAAALLAMRIVSAVLCSLLIGAAVWVTAQWARTAWPAIGIAAVLTPVVLYSNALPAPNGVEMCAALGLWVTLVGIARVPFEERGRFLLLATGFALPLAVVRGLGPLWLAAILLVWAVSLRPARLWSLLREQPRTTGLCAAVVVTVTGAATLWTMVAGSMELEETDPPADPLLETITTVPLWFLQSIAAFPSRNEPAPTVVYAAAGIVLTTLLLAGWLHAGRWMKVTLAVAFGLALGLAFVLQYATVETAGLIWQGRYGWPLSLGVLVLCATALDDRPPRGRFVGPVLVIGAALWLLAHVVSTVDVVRNELATSPLAGDSRWVGADPWLVGTLTTLGVLTLVVGIWRTQPPSTAWTNTTNSPTEHLSRA